MDTLPSITPKSAVIKSHVQNMVSVAQSLRRVVSSRGGQRWQIEMEYPPMTRDEAAALWTFLNALSGRYTAFYFNLPFHSARGTMLGAPVVSGADQVGKNVMTSGWPASSPGLLRVGDFIRFDGRYKTYQVTADVSSDSEGNATIPIFPALQESPADEVSVIADSRFCCSLTSDTQEVSINSLLHYGLSISMVEVLG